MATTLAAIVGLVSPACATIEGMHVGQGDFSWVGGDSRLAARPGPLHVRWVRPLSNELDPSAYVPVEWAIPALDEAHDRVYVGAANGKLWAFSSSGTPVYQYDARGAIESAPAVDPSRGELFVGTSEGVLHALNTRDGSLRYRVDVQGAIRNTPVLTDDAVYVVTANDYVLAFRRENGEALWSYHRDPIESFAVAGHAGLTRAGRTLLTGFTDGVVVALDVSDGRVRWERDTSLDRGDSVETNARFLDVDTSPVVVGDRVYVASASAGLYVLGLEDGEVLLRNPELEGVTSIAETPDGLVLTTTHGGLLGYDSANDRVTWRRPVLRGSPSSVVVTRNVLLVGESEGALLAVSRIDGRELSRVEYGRGFSAPPAVAGHFAFAVTNGGSLMALQLGAD